MAKGSFCDKCDLQDSPDQGWLTKRERLDQISMAMVSFNMASDYSSYKLFKSMDLIDMVELCPSMQK